jgi:hypothetical protein
VEPATRGPNTTSHHRLKNPGEAKEQGWLGEVAAIETTMAAAEQKLIARRSAATQQTTTSLGMPGVRLTAGRSSPDT